MTQQPDDLDLIMLSIQDYNLKHKGEEHLVLAVEDAIDQMREALNAAVNWYAPPKDSWPFPIKQVTEAAALSIAHPLRRHEQKKGE